MSGGRPELVEAVRRLGVRHGVTLAPSLNKPFGRAAIVQALAGIEPLLAVSLPPPAQA
jgi:hypothetical protein